MAFVLWGIRYLGHNVKRLKCQQRRADKEVGEVRGPPEVETELGLERQIGFGTRAEARRLEAKEARGEKRDQSRTAQEARERAGLSGRSPACILLSAGTPLKGSEVSRDLK